MSESPKSRTFGFAAMLNWAKDTLGCRSVPPFLVALCLIGTLVLLPSTVSAQSITSPYAGVNWSNQYKAALHLHTTNSDGNATPAQLLEELYRRGYDIVTITDHIQNIPPEDPWPNAITPDWVSITNGLTQTRYDEIAAGEGRGGRGMLMIPYTGEQSQHDHINTYFANYNNPTGTVYTTPAEIYAAMRETLQAVQNLGGLARINHPSRYTGGAATSGPSGGTGGATGANISNNPDTVNKYVDLFMDYSACVGMEIVNRQDGDSASDRILWDNILKQTIPLGRNVWGFADDDYHGSASSTDAVLGSSFNMFLMSGLTQDAFRQAMVSGSFYAVAKVAKRELGNGFIAAGSTPIITSIAVNQATITMSAGNFNRIDWISEGKVIGTGETLNVSTNPNVGVYVRANVMGLGGIAFTQALGTGFVPATPGAGAQTTRGGSMINASHYTHTGTADFVINSQHTVGGYRYDAYVMNSGTIGNADIRFGTLANDATLNNATVGGTLGNNGTLVNYTGRTITGSVNVGVGGYVANEGTINNLTMTGGAFFNDRSTVGTNSGTTVIGATIGEEEEGEWLGGWLYNAVGTVRGSVDVGGYGAFENSSALAAIANITVSGRGTVHNYGASSRIITLEMNDNSVVHNGAGGRIDNLTYYGGAYFNNVNDKYTNFGSGTIGTLNLAGDSTGSGSSWGTVDTLTFDSNKEGSVTVFAFASGGWSLYSGIRADTVDFTDGNILLDLSRVSGISGKDWTTVFFNAFGYEDGFYLKDLFYATTDSGAGSLHSLKIDLGRQFCWILDKNGGFADGWSIEPDGFVSWDGTKSDLQKINYILQWTGSEDGTSWNWTTENWWGYDPYSDDPDNPDTDTHFVNGDVVQFLGGSSRTINIAEDSVVVAEMFVSGSGNWTFKGGEIIGDIAQSSLADYPPADDPYFTGSLGMYGTGTLTFSNDVEFKGGVTVASGTLQIGNGGTTGWITIGTGIIENNGNVAFNRSDNLDFYYDISGTGSLTKKGTGMLTLHGTYDYTGRTTVESGDLVVSNLSGTGAIEVRNGATLSGLDGTSKITSSGSVNNYGQIFDLQWLKVAGNVTNRSSGMLTLIDEITVDGTLNNSGIIVGIEKLKADSATNSGEMVRIDTITVNNELSNTGEIVDFRELTAGRVNNYGWMSGEEKIDVIGTSGTGTGDVRGGSLVNTGIIDSIDSLTVKSNIFAVRDGIVTVGNNGISNSGYLVNIGSINVDIDDTKVEFYNASNKIDNGNGKLDSVNGYFLRNQSGGVIAGVSEINMGKIRTTHQSIGGDDIYLRNTFDNRGTIYVGNVIFRTNTQGTPMLDSQGNPELKFNGIGEMTIDGNFTSTGGTFVIGVKGDESSCINIVNGSASIAGGTVDVMLIDQTNYLIGQEYVFLKVEPGDNPFDPDDPYRLNVDSQLMPGNVWVQGIKNDSLLNDPLLKAIVRHDDQSYWFSLVRAFTYSGEGKTLNQRAVGKYVDVATMYPAGDFRQVLLALQDARMGGVAGISRTSSDFVAPAEDPMYRALDQMSGSIYGTATMASFRNTVMLHSTLANVLRRDSISFRTDMPGVRGQVPYYPYPTPYPTHLKTNPTDNLWGMVYGHAGSSAFDGNINGYRQGFAGIMVGFDRTNERQRRLGLFLSAGDGSLSSDLNDRTLSKEFMLGHYFRKDGQYGYMLVQAGVGTHRYDTRRQITFGCDDNFINRTATNQHNAFLATGHFEMGFRYRGGILNLSPYAGLEYTGLLREGFTENGAGSLNLTADRRDYHTFRPIFGMRFDSAPFRVRNGLASFYGNVAWMYEFEAKRRPTEFTARFTEAGILDGPSFTVHGNDPGRDWVQAGFGLNYDINIKLRAFAGYDAYANQHQVLHAANLGFVYQR